MTRCNNCFFEYDNKDNKCPECGYVSGDAAKEPFHLYPGTELAERYIIGEAVGFGGFGITYKAWDKKLSHLVAVKEYYPGGVVNRTPGTQEVIIYAQKRKKEYDFGKERFLEEARNMAKFNSESNIVNVFEYFEANNTAYIVMEFLNGISLSAYLHTNEEKIDIDTGIEIAENIGNALIRIHEKGIIHRDVSPDNIFLCLGGGMKLIDFGAARFSQEENKLMTIVLKPGFAPPEQYEKVNHQGPWTDVYALGATLYYAITGVKPDESTNRKINDTLLYPHEVNTSVPENLSNAIMKAMAVEVHMRYQNVEEFLNAIHSSKKVLSVKEEKKIKKRRRIIGISGAGVILAAGIVLGVTGWETEKDNETLPDCTMTMWYCKSGDEKSDEAERNAYESIISDFRTSFPNVEITLEGFSESEYKEKLLYSEEPPCIFEYEEGITEQGSLDLSEIYKSDNFENCTVLKNAENYFGGKHCLPMGFVSSVVYENTALSDTDVKKIKTTDELKSNDVITDNPGYSEMFEDTSVKYSDNAFAEFSSEKAAFLISTTDKYNAVAKKLPAQYKLIACDTDNVYCRYSHVWTANDLSDAQNKASARFLEYMLNNNSQDALHVQNVSDSLPVNDSIIGVYSKVYDDFEGFFDNIANYSFGE